MTETDVELLQRFAATHDEGAFVELVHRHPGLVYATALGRLRPLLDGALQRLAAKDRDALVLRFFENRGYRHLVIGTPWTEAQW